MAPVQLITQDSITDQLEHLHQRIAERAYSLFVGRNGVESDPMTDWIAAERELVWKPAIEVREQDGTFTVTAALPGVQAKDIKVDVTSRDVVIKAETEHGHDSQNGTVHCCEFFGGEAFRAVELPKPIDTARVKAEFQNGILRITAPAVPESQPTRVQVTAA